LQITSPKAELLRLASLFVDTFEIGTRKAEQDVGDDICRRFGIALDEVEMRHRSLWRTTLTDSQRGRLRRDVASLLADRASSPAALMNAVAKAGAKFLEMVNEVYRLLSQHAATSQRPAEQFRFRARDVDLDLVLSSAFVERVRRLYKSVVQVETGTIDEEKLRGLLGIDGDFYGHWPVQQNTHRLAEGSRNLARAITFLAWLRDELDHRGNDFDVARQELRETFAAAERFVDQAMFLVQAHVESLDLADDEPDSDGAPDADKNEEYHLRVKRAERRLFRERRWLRSGLTPSKFGVSANPASYWLHVDVSRLIAADSASGSIPDCIQLLDADDPYVSGTIIGSLACLCGIWKAALRRKPTKDDSQGLREALDTGDQDAVIRWLSALTSSLDEAGHWLREEVWQPMGTASRERILQDYEDFLNLPLWRHRWLLYEIWLIATTIQAAVSQGWVCRLHLVKAGADTWALPLGDAAEAPCALLNYPGAPEATIEVWYQDRRRRNCVDMKPDVALETPAPSRRDLVIVEGKDKYRMPIRGKKGPLAIGQEYREASCAEATWVVNYCPFLDKRLLHPETNHGNAWHALHFASEFKPGNVPDCFVRSIGQAIVPSSLRTLARVDRPDVVIFVIDTTGSMHRHLEQIWMALRNAASAFSERCRFKEYGCLLFGDHDANRTEPYLICQSDLLPDVDQVVEFARRQPLCSGGNEPEALEDALRAGNEFGRRLGRTVCFVIFTDAPPHSPSDCPNGINFQDEVSRLLQDGNHCFVVQDWLTGEARDCWRTFESDHRFHWIGIDDLPRVQPTSPTHAH